MAYFTLDATVGGSAANTYIATVADMRAIRNTLGAMTGIGADFTGFDAASDDVLIDVAVLAAAAIDTQAFPGYKKTAGQLRMWPRVSTRLPQLDSTVPDGIKFAQVAEMAALTSAASEAALSARSGVVSWTAGKKSVTYDTSTLQLTRTAKISDPTLRVLTLFNLVAGAVASVYLPRG